MNIQAVKSHADISFIEAFSVQLACDLSLHQKDIETLSCRTKKEGVSFLTDTLPLLAKALEQGLGQGVLILPTNFKKVKRGWEIPAFLGSFFRRVFSSTGHLLDDFDVVAVYVIRQFCLAFNKVDLPYKPEKAQRVIENFVAVEEELDDSRNSYDFLESFSQLPNALAATLFSDYSPDRISPKYGPGISSNVSPYERYSARLSANLDVYRDYSQYFWFNPEDSSTRLGRHPISSHFTLFRQSAEAKVLLVPKDSRGPRLISCEPHEHMFIQQGVMEYMVDRLESHPLTRGRINFSNQSTNQDLAIEASLNQKWATLDLKDASDRVSLDLVQYIFDGSPLLTALLSTRSNYTILPDGRRVRLSKFAPMGSALCFPVMAFTIFSLVVSTLVKAGMPLKDALDSVFVYGDDLIVPSEYAAHIIEHVQQNSPLRFNTNKCFIDSVFAESCGVDACRGNNVTPVRLRCVVQNRSSQFSNQVASVLATAHQLYLAGLARSSEFLYSKVESYLGPLPYGSLRSPYLCRLTTSQAIPEMNFCQRKLRWKKQQDLGKFPLGRSLRVWKFRPSKKNIFEGPYERMMRTHSLWGGDIPLPKWGETTQLRSLSLVRGLADHYDQC